MRHITMCLATSVVLAAGLTFAAKAAEPLPVLDKAAQIRALAPDAARLKYPVLLHGTVTFYAPDFGLTFVQDASAGIFLNVRGNFPNALPGDIVEVAGVTGPGEFAPVIDNPRITIVGRGPLPVAQSLSVGDLLTGEKDSRWVSVKAIVHSAERQEITSPDGRRHAQALLLGVASGRDKFQVWVANFPLTASPLTMIDAAISVKGVCVAMVNEKRQLVGIQLMTPGIDQVRIEQQPPVDRYVPVISTTSSLMQFRPERLSGHRIRVRGVVTLVRPGKLIFVQDETGGVVVDVQQTASVAVGDLVDAVGFPEVGLYEPVLKTANFEKLAHARCPYPSI